MRIAFFSWEAVYGVSVGGVALHAFFLAQALARRGHDVHLFTRLGPGQRLGDLVFGVQYHRCPCEQRLSFVEEATAMCATFAHYAQEEERKNGFFDLIHCCEWLTAQVGLALRRENRTRFAIAFHTTEWGRAGQWPEKGEARQIAAIERQAVEASDIVIAASQEVKRQLDILYQCPDWKTELVRPGIDLTPFDRHPFDPGAVKASLQIAALAPTVLFVGSLSSRKGADILLESAPLVLAKRPDVCFVFAGDGDLRGHLERQAERGHIKHAVRFLGQRPGNDLIDLYRACDVVCVPARTDPFGLATLSAWAASKPVVACRGTVNEEYILPNGTGLLVAREPAAIAEGLLDLFADFDRLRWLGRNGRVAAETAFTWDKAAEMALAAYARGKTAS